MFSKTMATFFANLLPLMACIWAAAFTVLIDRQYYEYGEKMASRAKALAKAKVKAVAKPVAKVKAMAKVPAMKSMRFMRVPMKAMKVAMRARNCRRSKWLAQDLHRGHGGRESSVSNLRRDHLRRETSEGVIVYHHGEVMRE